MFKKEVSRWSMSHHLIGLLVFCFCMMVSISLFYVTHEWEKTRFEYEFDRHVQIQVARIHKRFNEYQAVVQFVAHFMDNTVGATRKEFKGFVTNVLNSYPGMQAISWNPRIKNDQRLIYESAARKDGFQAFNFTEKNKQGTIIKATERSEYIVVYYMEPMQGNEAALGYDIRSNSVIHEAIKKATDSGKLWITDSIKLVQEKESQAGILMLQPIYKLWVPLETITDRRKYLEGFVVGVIRVGQVIETVLDKQSQAIMNINIYDIASRKGNELLYHNNMGVTDTDSRQIINASSTYKVTYFELGGHQWQLLFTPTVTYIKSQHSWISWWVLTGALLFTVFLMAYLLKRYSYIMLLEKEISERQLAEQSLARYQTHLEDLVKQRTESLTQSNEQLQQEIVERKEMASALSIAKIEADQANHAKGLFLANMSHEIRTPMNAVLGMTELMLSTDLDEQQVYYAETVYRSGNALVTIINDILDFSKIESGNLKIESMAFNLKQKLNDILEAVRPDLEKKKLVHSIKIDDELPLMLVGDPVRIGQVITNLFYNAIKFTHEGYVSIFVDVVTEDEHSIMLRFVIADTGIGIADDVKSQLFQPFIQAENSIARKYGGTGLGLSISKNLAHMMGGDVTFQSEVGRGSKFTFTAKLEKTTMLPATEIRTLPGLMDLSSIDKANGYTILIAEDEHINQVVIGAILQKLGYKTIFASDGKQVVVIANKNKHDLILMDISMPEMDGYQATKIIREQESIVGENNHTPIIALTAHAIDGIQKDCLSAGMDDYLSKPVRSHILKLKLEQWLH